MGSTRRHTHLTNSDLTVVVLTLGAGLRVATLRAMLAAELYILCGTTRTPEGEDSGYGAYVGQSEALQAKTVRVGVSLRTWTYAMGRLEPDTVILVRGARAPIAEQPRLLVESALARSISAAGYTILNTRTASPTAAARAPRHQRLWAVRAAEDLHGAVHQILRTHVPAAAGGSTREQLIRLVLAHGPMDVRQLLDTADRAGVPVAGRTPQQRSRRDVTTRELSSGRPRVYRTHIDRRTVVYPASMRLRDARRQYATNSRPTPE